MICTEAPHGREASIPSGGQVIPAPALRNDAVIDQCIDQRVAVPHLSKHIARQSAIFPGRREGVNPAPSRPSGTGIELRHGMSAGAILVDRERVAPVIDADGLQALDPVARARPQTPAGNTRPARHAASLALSPVRSLARIAEPEFWRTGMNTP